MKRFSCILLALCMLLCLALPIAAADTKPFDVAVGASMEAVSASVGADTAGAAVVLYKNGSVVMSDGFGYADLSAKTLVTASTLFEIGEVSSTFVSVAALVLEGEGKLSLDVDIFTYLSADFAAKLALSYPVTVRQLLTGRAGFGGRIFDNSFDKEGHTFETLEEAILADVPAQVTLPGTAYSYSPFGIALAAFVIETVSGVSYNDYLTDKILAPLGMKNTYPFVGETVPDGYAVGYVTAGQGNFTAPHNGGKTYAGLYPATGMVSSAGDLAKFISWLLGESDVILTKTARAQLLDTYESGIFRPTSLGFSACDGVLSRRAKTACFGASLALDRSKMEAVLVLTNTAENALLAYPETALSSTAPLPVYPTGELLELKTLRGTYASTALEQRSLVGRLLTSWNCFSVTPNDDGTLTFGEMHLVQVARGVFADAKGDGTTPVLQFLLDEQGKVTAVVTADGAVYQKLPFYYAKTVFSLLFGLVVILTCGFFLLGLYSLFEWLTWRDRKGERFGLLRFLPELLSAILALFIGLQIVLAYKLGTEVLSSFYFAMRVLSFLAGLGATVVYVLAFVLTVLDRKKHHRIAYAAVIYLFYVFLICFFGLTLF